MISFHRHFNDITVLLGCFPRCFSHHLLNRLPQQNYYFNLKFRQTFVSQLLLSLLLTLFKVEIKILAIIQKIAH